MRRWHRLALAGALSLLAAPALAAVNANDAVPNAGAARAQALTGFQHDLVSVLALRATATPLLGAALLARPLTGQPKTTSFHTLVNRAVAVEGSGAAAQWLRLADCERAECPNPGALHKLTETDVDNAAVWLLKFDLDSRDLKTKTARADLAKAAAATHYDDYAGASLTALVGVVDALPPPPATLSASGALGVQALIALGNARLQPRPVLPVAAQWCKGHSGDATAKADCLRLGQLLAWGSSPLARSLGLHLIATLSDDPAAVSKAQGEARDLAWQVHNHAQLALAAPDDAATAQALLAAARAGGTEMSQLQAVLRARGVSPTAPGSWQPASPAASASTPSP